MVADFQVNDRVPFADVKVVVEFMVQQYLEGIIDTIEVIYPRYKNTLVQLPMVRPVAAAGQFAGLRCPPRPRGGRHGQRPA